MTLVALWGRLLFQKTKWKQFIFIPYVICYLLQLVNLSNLSQGQGSIDNNAMNVILPSENVCDIVRTSLSSQNVSAKMLHMY